MRRSAGFTLIEIMIAVFIMLLLLMVAVPSINGVLADRRLRRSFDAMNNLVHQAQALSMKERRAYLIIWEKEAVVLRPEAATKEEEEEAHFATLRLARGDAFQLKLPAALVEDPPAEWTFWPSGACEPAIVRYTGNDGTWEATYSPLTALAQINEYAAK